MDSIHYHISGKHITAGRYQLRKFPGKGGWTYAEIPTEKFEKATAFGWKRVKGFIDSYELKQFHLMQMADGKLFLPVKKEIREFIKKKSGDWIEVRLWHDEDPVEIPEDVMSCFHEEPELMKIFHQFKEEKQLMILKKITSAKTQETRVKRIADLMNVLSKS